MDSSGKNPLVQFLFHNLLTVSLEQSCNLSALLDLPVVGLFFFWSYLCSKLPIHYWSTGNSAENNKVLCNPIKATLFEVFVLESYIFKVHKTYII